MTRWRAAALCSALLAITQGARAASEDAQALTRAEDVLRASADRLSLVEREYGQAEDPSDILRLRKNFADGETQYLLGEYANAAALLYDVVDAPIARAEEMWPDALYDLADSLYHLQSWLEARRYYRQLLDEHVGRVQQEALLRLIELSDKTSDWSGIDEFYRQLLATSAELKPEVVYFHAKWLARRPDLADAERIARGLEAFRAIPDNGSYGAQARYFEGALLVQKGDLDAAAAAFERLLALPVVMNAPTAAQLAAQAGEKPQGEAAVRAEIAARESRIRDLSRMALGRIYFEKGKYALAVDQYEAIQPQSISYNDALYELAATWLKLGEFEKALHTTGLLLVLVEDSPIAPEARLLEANLYLKLRQFVKAQAEFESISDEYRPVREKIAELIKRDNPVSYYEELLQQGDKSLDATLLLPEIARKYVSGRDVGQARVIIGELSAGRQGLGDSEEILRRLEAALQQGKLDLFPTLQEGNARAVEVENSLLRVDGTLASVQSRVVEREAPQLKGALDRARADRLALEARTTGALPETSAAHDERRKAYSDRVEELEKTALRAGLEIENIKAQLEAAQKWRAQTEAQRKADPAAEREFAAAIERDRGVAAQLEDERQALERQLEVAKAQSSAAASGGATDDKLRAALLAAVRKEADAARATAAVLGPEGKVLFARIAPAAEQVLVLRDRAQQVRRIIRERAAAKLLTLRSRLERERNTVADYRKSVEGIDGGTRQLLGRIAFNSFTRVERQFYDLVLKADVGVVDTAWTQKKDRTDAITALENEKRGQLKSLQDEFGEVLKEVE